MAISMYQASVPVFARGLSSLKTILTKGAAHAAAKKIDESVFINARLFPDMLPLKAQVFIASDFARGTVARLSGTRAAEVGGQRVDLRRVDRARRPYRRSRQVVLGRADRRLRKPSGHAAGPRRAQGLPGINYLLQYSLPNFYFHTTTAYAILRSNGVEIGKGDFIGALD